jgi:hypothetical protein
MASESKTLIRSVIDALRGTPSMVPIDEVGPEHEPKNPKNLEAISFREFF